MLSWLIAAIALGAPAEPASPALEAFFNEFTQKRAGVASLRAEYTQTDVLPEDTNKTRGKLLYIKPRRIIQQSEDPVSTILMDNRRGYLYEPEIQQLQIFEIEDDPQSDVLFLGFDEDIRKLEEAYDVKLLTTENTSRGLVITPKFDPHRDPLFEELNILFEEKNLLPKRIEVINDDGSKTIYEVTNYQINGAVDAAETQIALPEGTKVLENNEVRETAGPGGLLLPDPLLPGSAQSSSDKEKTTPEIEVRPLEPLTPPADNTSPAAPAPANAGAAE
ncbi:MAG: outer membrane lipoprotein carrier protein LolA [Candidatus Hydrogenedentes bacterium]|nr:outer membrane lipoprotein carrier protein LolA [Candidatus Hydrogenedentota bacterium]MBI3119924.1 outer membrane lipoprotein carrier protein LolA [Candidatus Hydrogenedentota bacterium]